VVVRFTAAGTHTGDGLGFPATNARMRVSGITIARVEDGVLTEGWNIFDSMGLLQQLGILPPPAAKW
jgi:predicted ester cyclase